MASATPQENELSPEEKTASPVRSGIEVQHQILEACSSGGNIAVSTCESSNEQTERDVDFAEQPLSQDSVQSWLSVNVRVEWPREGGLTPNTGFVYAMGTGPKNWVGIAFDDCTCTEFDFDAASAESWRCGNGGE